MFLEGITTGDVGQVTVVVSPPGRGHSPEAIAERALARILAIGEKAPPELLVQAEAFKDDLRKVLIFYMHEAVKSHNTTIAARLRRAGHSDLVALLND